MVAYGLYIYDRHCTCCFYSDLDQRPHPDSGPSTLPHVLPPPPPAAAPAPAPGAGDDPRVYALPNSAQDDAKGKGRLAFDEEAKLVYGVVFSLRNLVSKLSSRDDESFHSVSTSAYKLHYLRTPTAFHLVLLTSPNHPSLRPLLRQIYTGPFNEFVVRNPLADLDTQQSGRGIDNKQFRRAVEKMLAAV
ncbi:Trafficking protein particle complex subunit BET5 [Rhodotorula kratochvilovae]